MRRVGPAERRARLAVRHGLHPDHRLPNVLAATTAMVGLHGTDPAGVYLAALARVDPVTARDVDQALYGDRSVVKHLAMRRTLFVFSREHLTVARAAVGARVAAGEVRTLVRDVERAELHPDGATWLQQAGQAVLQVLADGRPRSLEELREAVPLLRGATVHGVGRSWGGSLAVGPRVLTVLSARGDILRAGNQGHWRTSRHLWASTRSWLGHDLQLQPADQAMVALVEAWLRTFGPGTDTDLRWWTGTTLTAVRAALARLEAVPVDLDGQVGYLLPDDLAPPEPVSPWAGLLPVLDPTVMGWKERQWYVGDHRERIFDTAGNAGPTVWWDGRIIGTWYQDPSGVVLLDLFQDVGRNALRQLQVQAERVAAFCEGTQVVRPFASSAAGPTRLVE